MEAERYDDPEGGPSTDARFRAIYEAELAYVWRVLHRFGARPGDVEDLAHDVFVALYRGLDRYDPSRPVRPWLSGIAFRVFSDHRRRSSYTREVHVTVLRADEATPSAHAHLEAAERRALVDLALSDLVEDQRVVFVLHELEGLPVPEIARSLSIPENTAYSRLRLARRRFADRVREIAGGGGA